MGKPRCELSGNAEDFSDFCDCEMVVEQKGNEGVSGGLAREIERVGPLSELDPSERDGRYGDHLGDGKFAAQCHHNVGGGGVLLVESFGEERHLAAHGLNCLDRPEPWLGHRHSV